jgi:hypothetical protein
MRSLDPCPGCPAGTLVAYRTRRIRKSRFAKRYLKCDAGCSFRGLEVVRQVPRRVRRRTRLVPTTAQKAAEPAKMPVDPNGRKPC